MKLLKRDRNRLETILAQLERAQRFILSDQFQYVMPKGKATTTTDLQESTGKAFSCPLNKEVGTELCILYNATNQLRRALQYEELEAK